MNVPDPLTADQHEILITLRALAGLVAEALREKAALALEGVDEEEAGPARERADAQLLYCRDLLLYHVRRLLPALAGHLEAQDPHLFAEELVRALYLEDQEASRRHGCDPLRGTHAAHRRG
jgi:hypothetical protein